jgi:hypothetical protein
LNLEQEAEREYASNSKTATVTEQLQLYAQPQQPLPPMSHLTIHTSRFHTLPFTLSIPLFVYSMKEKKKKKTTSSKWSVHTLPTDPRGDHHSSEDPALRPPNHNSYHPRYPTRCPFLQPLSTFRFTRNEVPDLLVAYISPKKKKHSAFAV